MISLVQSSKFPFPVLTAGPTGTLAIAGTDYLWSDFWAIAVVADGVGVIGSTADGVTEEKAA